MTILWAGVLSTQAQTPPPPDPFDIAISFDLAGTIYAGTIPGFAAPTRLYFQMLDLGEQIVGYESSVYVQGPGSEGWVISRGTPEGLDLDPSPDGYVVGIGVCAGTVGSNYLINTYDLGYFSAPQAPLDNVICAGPPTVSNPSIPGFPSYQTCGGELRPSGVHPPCYLIPTIPDGCARINPSEPVLCILLKECCTVPTRQTSWGALKAGY